MRLAHGPARERGLYLAHTKHPVKLSPAEPFELELLAEYGARLTLEVGTVGWPPNVPEPLRPEDQGYRQHLREHGLRAVFASDEPNDFSVDPPRLASRALLRSLPPGYGAGLVDRWLPDETHTHWRVESPGRYLVRVSGDGWNTFEHEVELRAGEETYLRAVLTAR